MEKRILISFAAVMTALLSCAAVAQVPLQDPKVRLEAAMKHAAGLPSLGFTESFKGLMVSAGESNESILKGELVFRGQDRLSGQFSAENEEIRLVSDGTTHNLYVIGGKTYERTDEPISRSQLMTAVTGGILRAGGMWVADFLHNRKELLEAAETVERKGSQEIDGTACDGFFLSYPGFDVTAWLTQSDPPVLRRTEVNLEKSAKGSGHEGGAMSASVQVDITDWKPGVETKDSQFVFTPPDGVEVAKSRAPEDTFKGKPAEEFELPLLDGGTVKLSGLKGKTVVLDFWATWCGPCRVAMPIIEKVTAEFADKNVVLYTVNREESGETIKAFLQTMKLNPKVALDKDGKVSLAYGATSIPSIVIIRPDGVISEVFRGVSPQFEEDLRRAIQAAGEAPPSAK